MRKSRKKKTQKKRKRSYRGGVRMFEPRTVVRFNKKRRHRRKRHTRHRRRVRSTRRRRRERMTHSKRKGGKPKIRKKSTRLPITVLCDSVDAASDAACEIIGLGPEDPLADVCAYEAATHIAKFCKRFISKYEPSAVKEILNNPMSFIKHLTRKNK